MKKWLVILLISGTLIISGGWFTASYLSNDDSHSADNHRDEAGNKTTSEASTEIDATAYTESTGLSTDSSQSNVVDVMHKMTHQKVKASEKWGSVRMTEATIAEVRKTIEDNQFEQEEELLSILDKWSKGDFSTVDDDHNYFWSLQDGTIGKATGILSAEEEEAFIKKYFE